MNAGSTSFSFIDFVVADLKLADWGRKEIRIAETEMPGLVPYQRRTGAHSFSMCVRNAN